MTAPWVSVVAGPSFVHPPCQCHSSTRRLYRGVLVNAGDSAQKKSRPIGMGAAVGFDLQFYDVLCLCSAVALNHIELNALAFI
jgi:hypothetical protein